MMLAADIGNCQVVQAIVLHLESSDVVQEAVKQQAIDATNNRGTTALMIAAHRGHLPVVNTLLDAKADVFASSNAKWNAFLLAAAHGHDQVISSMYQ